MEPMLFSNVNQVLKDSKPGFLDRLELVAFNLGDTPPKIAGKLWLPQCSVAH